MRIQLWSQYFWPETVGAGIWIHQLASGLAAGGHQVSVVTAFPNYPEGRVFDKYAGRWLMREEVDSVRVLRTYIHAVSREGSFFSRAASFGSFCTSSVVGGLISERPDVIYAILPPLPLGWSAELAGVLRSVPVVINVQDIYPDIAVSLGYLKNRTAIRFFERMEKRIYRRAAAITVIGESFRDNLAAKGVPADKIVVIPNWADSSEIQPGPRNNALRQAMGGDGKFLLVYSGGMGHNASLEVLIEAAALLRDEPFRLVMVGDGANRRALERLAADQALANVQFMPFQPLELYPDVLAASDAQAVTLNEQATAMSLPSKVLKIMASGRAVVSLARPESDLARVVANARCGISVLPSDAPGLAQAVRRMAASPDECAAMGMRGREYMLKHFERTECVEQIESVLRRCAAAPRR